MLITEIVIIILLVIVIAMQIRASKAAGNNDDVDKLQKQIESLGGNISAGQSNVKELVSQNMSIVSDAMLKSQSTLSDTLDKSLKRQEERLKTFSGETEQKLENIRGALERRLKEIQDNNNQKLEDMRKTVDEKLQQTLEQKMNESFKLVSERLEQVYKGLGEMQSLANGVGDLKKVLTNVKTRGIVGEIQLGAILEDILSPEQYDTNCKVVKGEDTAVEFAVKIPTKDGSFAYLPIDAKFPGDTYKALLDAYDSSDKQAVDTAAKALITRIKSEAKDISTKYIYPPDTTEFAVMFLPFEGLYCEVVNRGLLEELQRTYHVTVAGPSTMAAMLCSIRMCFKSVAIQRYSSEVWQVLGAVKTEFGNFEEVLNKTKKKLDGAAKELDSLIGTRTRAINSKLNFVTELDLNTAQEILNLTEVVQQNTEDNTE